MINHLTEQQQNFITEYSQQAWMAGIRTKQCSREKTVQIITDLYKNLDMIPPKEENIYITPCPKTMIITACKLINNEPINDVNINTKINLNDFQKLDIYYGNHNSYWVYYYKYFYDVFGIKPKNEALYQTIIDLTNNLHWCIFFEKTVVVSKMPIKVFATKKRIINNEHGPAIIYENGTSFTFINGKLLPLDINKNNAILYISHPDENIKQAAKYILKIK